MSAAEEVEAVAAYRNVVYFEGVLVTGEGSRIGVRRGVAEDDLKMRGERLAVGRMKGDGDVGEVNIAAEVRHDGPGGEIDGGGAGLNAAVGADLLHLVLPGREAGKPH